VVLVRINIKLIGKAIKCITRFTEYVPYAIVFVSIPARIACVNYLGVCMQAFCEQCARSGGCDGKEKTSRCRGTAEGFARATENAEFVGRLATFRQEVFTPILFFSENDQ